MEISVGMVVNDAAKRDKYKNIVNLILGRELHRADISFYSSLNNLYESTISGNKKLNILIIPAAQQSFKLAKEIRVKDRNCIIIYPAQNMDCVLDSFESMPMAYVLPNSNPDKEILRLRLRKQLNILISKRRMLCLKQKANCYIMLYMKLIILKVSTELYIL